MGALALPGGRLAYGDPCTSLAALTTPGGPLPPGPHPVDALHIDFGHDARCAALRLSFSEAPVARWALASHPAGVDAGLVGLIDADDVPRWESAISAEGFDVPAALHARGASFTDHAAVTTLDGITVALCTSGWGDGVYDGWWGFDAAGTLCCFIADFDLLTTPEVDWVPTPSPLPWGPLPHPSLTACGVSAIATGPWTDRVAGWFGASRLVSRLELRWSHRPAVPRWRRDGRVVGAPRCVRFSGGSSTWDLSDPPPGARLTIGVLGVQVAAPRA